MPFLVGCLIKVVLAAIKGANEKPRLSAYDLQKAIMEFFTENKLYSTKGLFRHPSSAGKKTCFFSGLQDHLAGKK